MHSNTADSSRIKSAFSRIIASILAAVLSVAGLVALGPAAYAQTPGITQTVTHNGEELVDGAVLASGDTVKIALQYSPEVGDGGQVTIGLPAGVTVPESQLQVPGGSNAIETITQNADGDVVLTFMDPYPPNISQGLFELEMILDNVENSTSTEFSWMINGTPYTRDVIVTEPGAEQEDVSDHLGKSVSAGSLSQYVSVNQGAVSIDEGILNEDIEYTLNINTDRDTDRSDITITDELSPYLAYNEDSFAATITTWDDIGWNSTTEDFDFNPQPTENGFEYTDGLPNPSELTVTYSASVDAAQLEALTTALQEAYNELGGLGNFAIDLDNTVNVGGGGTDNANVTIGGERGEDDEPTVIDDAVNKGVAGTNLNQYISFDPTNGTVTIDDEITKHVVEYTLTVDTAAGTDRSNYTITDMLSKYLAYNQDSFDAEIITWDEDGWSSETNDFLFEPTFSDNSFTFTGDIPSSSVLTITYTASIDAGQLNALQEALQAEFDDLGVGSGDYRVQLENIADFGDDGERDANVSVGNHRGDGQGPENVSNDLDKSTGNSALEGYVSVYEDEVTVDDSILDAVIHYTLTIHTDGDTERSGYTISDELSQYLAYDEDSFEAEITTWNAEGWDQQTNSFAFEPQFSDNGFTFTGDIENPSELTITYSASVDPDQLEALTAALQDAFDELETGYGSFEVLLENTATFGADETRTGNVPVPGNLNPPEPVNVGDAFDKGADFSSVNIGPEEDGTLEPPQPVTYTFSADLSQWTGQAPAGYLNHEDYTLDRNVVISDTLPEQAEWETAAEDFISGMDLTEAAGFDGDAEAFAADEYQNQYAVVGQNLYINIGQDNATNVEVSAKALITTVEGLKHSNQGGIDRYELTNNAQFTYSDDEDSYGSSVRVTLDDRGDGLQNEAKFSKNAVGDDPVRVDGGESATVEYRFEANADWSNAVDVTKSYIVDRRDPNIFDFSDLDYTVESISGTLHGDAVKFDESHFDLSVNADGNLIIRLNDTGIALVDASWAAPTAPYVVDIALNTVKLTERQSLQIENSATLYGADDHALYWSTTTSEASSYGDEAEVRKSIRDTENKRWTQNLRVEVDEDGNLIQDHYVYNLAFIPHGNYEGVRITPEHDVLPEELEFIGFVTHDNVDTQVNPVEGPVDLGGNVEAVYDEDTHTITMQATGLLQQQPNISANVLVRVIDFELDTPVANLLGNSSAVFTPSDGYPLSIAKVNSEDDEVVINDPNSRFQVLDEDEKVVLENAFVENGFLRVLDEDGESRGLVVEEPGTYYVEEVDAPQGYKHSTDRITVVVDEDGVSEQQTFLNDPEDPEPAVSIIKGDAGLDPDPENPLIINDANTEDDAVAYDDGETRDIVINVHNTGNEDLVDVVLTDETQSGADIENLVWTLPNGETIEATANDDGVLIATWGGPWAVGDTITGTATLTLAAGEELHTNLASVDAVGAGSGIPVEDEDPYNGTPPPPTPAIQVDKNEPGNDEHLVEAGTHEFDVTFANTGNEALENFTWEDTTESGQDAQFNEDDIAGLEDLVLQPGESYTIRGSVEVAAGETHRDNFVVNADGVISGELVEDEDPTTYEAPEDPEPAVSIIKGDGKAEDGSIDNDANTADEAVAYENGETRDIVINVTNTGTEDLVDVVLTDETQSGTAIESLIWTLPNGDEIVAEDVDGVLTANWDGPWAPEEVITGIATLTLAEGEELHTNLASVTAVGAGSGVPVADEDPYNATPPEPVDPPTPNINVIKNDEGDDEHEVEAGEHDVVVVITNDGEEALEDFSFEDTTESGHDVVWNEEDLAGLTDLVLEVGDSYTVNGVVQVDAGENHRDNVVVNATGVISGDPVEDEDPTTYVAPDPLTYAIGDFVWIDENRDGIQDEGEDPLADVTVVLFDGEGSEIDRTETNSDGRYIFDNLEAGDYQVRFILTDEQAAIYEFTDYTAEEDVEIDSDAGFNGFSSTITLGEDNAFLTSDEDYEHFTVEATEGIDPTWDAGVVLLPEPEEPTYAIGDYVWVDTNRDGVQDDDESPLNDVTVVLYDSEGEELDRTTTNAAGRYIFDNLEAGEYSVGFELTDEQAERYEFTLYTAEDDVEVDSDAGEQGRSGVIILGEDNEFLTSNENYEHNSVQATEGIDPTWDAGVVEILNPELEVIKNEAGDDEHQVVAGEHDVVVTLTNDGNEALEGFEFEDTTESGHDVVWNVEDLAGWTDLVLEPGDSYTVNGVVQVDAGTTHRDNVVVDATGVISGDPVDDEDPTTYHADPTYAIGDYVWVDANNNGVQDEDEDPLSDVTVVLYDGEGEELDRTTTDENGRYIFDNLEAGEYQVQFVLTDEQAELYEFTSYTEGDDVEVDSNAGENGYTVTIVLNDDNQSLTADEDYAYNTVNASAGIDPTWDAGVVLIPDPEEPAVSIIKGDGNAEDGSIDNDANTADEAVAYENGETRDIVINVTNTGTEDLVDVVLTDETQSGTAIESLVWTLPNGDELAAEANDDGVLTASWDGPWAPEEVITGVATLTLAEGEELHTNLASVTAVGAGSGVPVADEDPYNANPPVVVEETPPPTEDPEPTPEEPEPTPTPEDPVPTPEEPEPTPEDSETPAPEVSETPSPTEKPEPTPEASETPRDKDGELSATGANFALMFGALGILLLLGGTLLYARNRKSNEA